MACPVADAPSIGKHHIKLKPSWHREVHSLLRHAHDMTCEHVSPTGCTYMSTHGACAWHTSIMMPHFIDYAGLRVHTEPWVSMHTPRHMHTRSRYTCSSIDYSCHQDWMEWTHIKFSLNYYLGEMSCFLHPSREAARGFLKAPARGVPGGTMIVRQGSGVAQASGPNPMSSPGVNSS